MRLSPYEVLHIPGLGFDGLTVTNEFFFASTQAVVKAAQKELGLTVDGKAGRDTITALGGVWLG